MQKPKKLKISDLPIEELYDKPKITPSVEKAIRAKENFSEVSASYCTKVCKMKCKKFESVSLLNAPVDVLIIQDHQTPDGKFDRKEGKQDQIVRNLLNSLCLSAGFQGLTYRITNLLKCPSNPTDFPKGKSPTTSTMAKCAPYLLQEIKQCTPKVIISLGTPTTKALGFKKRSNAGDRGVIDRLEGIPVVITQHPRILTMIRQTAVGSSGFWGSDYYEVIRKDFIKAREIALGKLNPPLLLDAIQGLKDSGRLRVARSMSDVDSILAEINALPPNALISFDTETTSLNPRSEDARLLMIQFGWRNQVTKEIVAGTIPLWHRKNKAYDSDEAWAKVVPLLEGPRGKIAFNAKFDILYIYHTTGVRVRNLKLDVMLALHSIDSGIQGCYGLKVAVSDYMPESGLAGYEDLLPGLSKKNDEPVTETITEEIPDA